jgi:outer membrane protein OmpA-like peptidoglycan-associated protein
MDEMKRKSSLFQIAALTCTLLPSCSTLPVSKQSEETAIVYALGSREGFSSPLNKSLRPACSALEFKSDSFSLTGGHHKVLSSLVNEREKQKSKFLVAGYTQPGLPEDYARSLSERRAQAVRQYLIENGIEAADLQTAGFGYDGSPNSPTSNVVVVYRQ